MNITSMDPAYSVVLIFILFYDWHMSIVGKIFDTCMLLYLDATGVVINSPQNGS